MLTADEKRAKKAAYMRAYCEANKEKLREYRAANRERRAANHRAWRAANPEHVATYNRQWEAANKERRSELNRAWCSANAEKKKETTLRWRKNNKERRTESLIQWRVENPYRMYIIYRRYYVSHSEKFIAANARRRARKLGATPSWLTVEQKQQIAYVYAQAARETDSDFIDTYVVDHIVPLQSKKVCGLHVPWNLQILTPVENGSKGNRLLSQDQLVDYSARGYIGTEFEPEKLIPRKAA